MKKFFLFVAAIALSISFTGCVDEPLGPDEPVNSDPAEITVSPAEITTTLEGGEFQLIVIANASCVENIQFSSAFRAYKVHIL